tara:strand:- start:423 stop:659 length:237 start_codon:yes stop_codon:yes gene_type:complete
MISERAAKAILKETSENREHSPAAINAYKRVCESWAIWFAKHIEKTMDGNTRVKPKDVINAYGDFFLNIRYYEGEENV